MLASNCFKTISTDFSFAVLNISKTFMNFPYNCLAQPIKLVDICDHIYNYVCDAANQVLSYFTLVCHVLCVLYMNNMLCTYLNNRQLIEEILCPITFKCLRL